eukprot:6206299-Pleurochrysis_carterae.AAC.5
MEEQQTPINAGAHHQRRYYILGRACSLKAVAVRKTTRPCAASLRYYRVRQAFVIRHASLQFHGRSEPVDKQQLINSATTAP